MIPRQIDQDLAWQTAVEHSRLATELCFPIVFVCGQAPDPMRRASFEMRTHGPVSLAGVHTHDRLIYQETSGCQ